MEFNNQMRKKVLLTGGAGFIGSHVAVSLMSAGYSVILYDNFENSSPRILEKIKKIARGEITLIEGDVRDSRSIADILSQNDVYAVMHFAGYKAVGESVEKPLKYYDVNVGGTISLLNAMVEANVNRLIFSSSCTVYGDPDYLPIDEQHQVHPNNPYGSSKMQAERIMKDLVQSRSDWKVISLRYFNPIGSHASCAIGEEPKGTPNNLIPYVTQVISGKRKELLIYGSDYDTKDGTGVRDYIHIMDLAEGHVSAVTQIESVNSIEFINLGTGNGYSVIDVVNAFEEIIDRKIPYRFVKRRDGDVAEIFADPSKAKNTLFWKAERSLIDMCRSAWEFEKALSNQ